MIGFFILLWQDLLKIGLDYFPLDVRFDDEIELLEAEEGLTGFAILIKLWQKIYSNGYYIEWNDDSILLFCKNINSEKTKVISVVNTCLRRNLFNKKLFDKYKNFNKLWHTKAIYNSIITI